MAKLQFKYFPYNGSKRWMVPHMEPLFRRWEGKGKFIDPFCGGGSPSWLARQTHPAAPQFLGDVDPWLLSVYEAQRQQLSIQVPQDYTDLKSWYALGTEDLDRLSLEQKALRFLICCTTAWGNRLESKPGDTLRFKVNPVWITSEYIIPKIQRMLGIQWLKPTDQVTLSDWKDTVAQAVAGDLVFLDPPYTETLGYTAKWDVTDQIDVWEMSETLAKRGVSVIVTNSAQMERIYRRTGFQMLVLDRPGTGKTGKARQEMLAWSPDLNPLPHVFEMP